MVRHGNISYGDSRAESKYKVIQANKMNVMYIEENLASLDKEAWRFFYYIGAVGVYFEGETSAKPELGSLASGSVK